MRFDNPTILEIVRKHELIKECPEYHLHRKKILFNDLLKNDAVLSFLMEHPQYRDECARRGHTREIREGINRLDDAWEYLIQSCPKVLEKLTPDKLIHLGKIVNPDVDGFRKVRVSLMLPDYTPPNYVRVPEYITDTLQHVKDEDMHVIEKAAFMHMRIAAIQPFIDGNKRVARLLQNKILDEVELPPATIPLGERDFYIGLLERAMCSYRDNKLGGQGPFFSYIAAKVNVSLDLIIKNLQDNNLCSKCFISDNHHSKHGYRNHKH